MDQTTLSIDERRVRMSELVERMAAIGLGVNFTPHYVEHIVAHMFDFDPEGYELFQQDWLDECEKLLTEKMVEEAEYRAKEAEAAARRASLMQAPPAKGPLKLVE